MQIDSIHIKAFGRLKNVKLQFDHQLNVLYGLNETGKSTLFHALSTLMMGFSPAKAELNSYMQWDNTPIEIEGQFTHKDKPFNVQRALKSTPSGLLFTGESREKLANQALPETRFISKDVFNSLFALHLDNLNGEVLKTKSWQEIKEYYMFELSHEGMASPSKVLSRIENERNGLLRSDNRGNQYIKDLTNRIKDLKGQVKLASAHFEAYELKQQSLNQLHKEHDTVKAQLSQLKVHQKQLELLLPLQELDNRLNITLSKFPSNVNYSQLKKALALDHELTRTNQLYDQVYVQNKKERMDCDALESGLKPLGENEQALYDARNVVVQLAQNKVAYEDRRRLLFTVEQATENHMNQLNLLFLEVFHSPYNQGADAGINHLDLSQVSEVLRKIKTLDTSQVIDDSFKRSPRWLLPLGIVALCLLSIGLLVALPMTPLRFMMILFNLVFSLTLGFWFWKQKSKYENLQDQIEQQKNVALKREELYEVFSHAMAEILPDSQQITHLDEGIIQHLIRMKGIVQAKQSAINQRDELMHLQNAMKEQLDAFESTFDLSVEVAGRLMRELEEKQRLWQVSREKWQYVLHQYEASQAVLMTHKARISQLEAEIQMIMHCDPAVWETQKNGIQEAVRHYEQLSADIEALAHLKTLKQDYHFETYDAMLNEKLEADAQLDDLQQRELRLYGDIRALEKDCDHLKAQDVYSDKLSELMGVEVMLEEAREQYVKLSILIEVLHYADDQFKVLYQPEYLQKASGYFSVITNGKYSEIIIDDNDSVLLKLKDQAIPIETMNSLSGGTLNQLYFSLFLSLIDVIDPHKVFPLFLDDVFLTWDNDRFESVLHLISDVSKTRQIFMLSCNSDYTKRCSQALNIKPIQLN